MKNLSCSKCQRVMFDLKDLSLDIHESGEWRLFSRVSPKSPFFYEVRKKSTYCCGSCQQQLGDYHHATFFLSPKAFLSRHQSWKQYLIRTRCPHIMWLYLVGEVMRDGWYC